jgi:CDP-glucose 4,6-dehydratase
LATDGYSSRQNTSRKTLAKRNGTLETLVKFWRGKKVFITGHTGFKGSWLSLWLHKLGAEVTGYALEPTTQMSLYESACIDNLIDSHIGDVRDFAKLKQSLIDSKAEIVIHMAAQSLVRYSYAHPVETYATNVMGTVHLLEAVRDQKSVRAVVNVTTDKCYENKEWNWGYRENEPLGGADPYSSSKACSEFVTRSYRSSFYKESAAIASARAGNVIGGGDWALDRLIPDIIRALSTNEPALIRNPRSIRPWQHVLEPLGGYLSLAQHLFEHGHGFAEAFNFGPEDSDAREVEWIVKYLVNNWSKSASYRIVNETEAPHEATYLKLDCSKAKARLGWQPLMNLEEALSKVVAWYLNFNVEPKSAREITLAQIHEYEKKWMQSE